MIVLIIPLLMFQMTCKAIASLKYTMNVTILFFKFFFSISLSFQAVSI